MTSLFKPMLATDADLATDLPQLPIDDAAAIAEFILQTLNLQKTSC